MLIKWIAVFLGNLFSICFVKWKVIFVNQVSRAPGSCQTGQRSVSSTAGRWILSFDFEEIFHGKFWISLIIYVVWGWKYKSINDSSSQMQEGSGSRCPKANCLASRGGGWAKDILHLYISHSVKIHKYSFIRRACYPLSILQFSGTWSSKTSQSRALSASANVAHRSAAKHKRTLTTMKQAAARLVLSLPSSSLFFFFSSLLLEHWYFTSRVGRIWNF